MKTLYIKPTTELFTIQPQNMMAGSPNADVNGDYAEPGYQGSQGNEWGDEDIAYPQMRNLWD